MEIAFSSNLQHVKSQNFLPTNLNHSGPSGDNKTGKFLYNFSWYNFEKLIRTLNHNTKLTGKSSLKKWKTFPEILILCSNSKKKKKKKFYSNFALYGILLLWPQKPYKAIFIDSSFLKFNLFQHSFYPSNLQMAWNWHIIPLSHHKQVCLMRLRFMRYFSHYWAM